VETRDRILRVAVRDDGLGGADPALGSGLLGLKDRAEAIGGKITLESRRGAGTSLHVELPLDADSQ
jgi:signal transduction histidine kinase